MGENSSSIELLKSQCIKTSNTCAKLLERSRKLFGLTKLSNVQSTLRTLLKFQLIESLRKELRCQLKNSLRYQERCMLTNILRLRPLSKNQFGLKRSSRKRSRESSREIT